MAAALPRSAGTLEREREKLEGKVGQRVTSEGRYAASWNRQMDTFSEEGIDWNTRGMRDERKAWRVPSPLSPLVSVSVALMTLRSHLSIFLCGEKIEYVDLEMPFLYFLIN